MKKAIIANLADKFTELAAIMGEDAVLESVTITDDRGGSGAIRVTSRIHFDGKVVEDVFEVTGQAAEWISLNPVA